METRNGHPSKYRSIVFGCLLAVVRLAIRIQPGLVAKVYVCEENGNFKVKADSLGFHFLSSYEILNGKWKPKERLKQQEMCWSIIHLTKTVRNAHEASLNNNITIMHRVKRPNARVLHLKSYTVQLGLLAGKTFFMSDLIQLVETLLVSYSCLQLAANYLGKLNTWIWSSQLVWMQIRRS